MRSSRPAFAARRGLLAALAATLALAPLAAPQVRPGAPAPPGPPPPVGTEMYGEPRGASLTSIVAAEESYQRAHVRTEGTLSPLAQGRYWELRDASASVLVLLGHGLDAADFDRFIGRRIELRGIVRRIRPKEYLQGVDADLIEDPSLPVLPAPNRDLPRVSLTALWFSPEGAEGRGGEPAPAVVAAILADPAGFAKRTVRVVGNFRGANLFGDLPEATRRAPTDWVLLAADGAVWVTGRPPRGKGFSLDAADRGESSWRLEVTGKPEAAGGVVYLKASQVKLAGRTR
ncbi:MAG: hypothetical protein AB7O37_11030 [Vicinamibacteria bacterium]